MEGGENILDAIYEEDDDDVEMVDIEEGELVEEHDSQNVSGKNGAIEDVNEEADKKQKPNSKNCKRRANKGKRKGSGSGSGSGSDAIDINRFVIDTCRCLKEKKSYMVYTAVGCLGVSALSDLVKEVLEPYHSL